MLATPRITRSDSIGSEGRRAGRQIRPIATEPPVSRRVAANRIESNRIRFDRARCDSFRSTSRLVASELCDDSFSRRRDGIPITTISNEIEAYNQNVAEKRDAKKRNRERATHGVGRRGRARRPILGTRPNIFFPRDLGRRSRPLGRPSCPNQFRSQLIDRWQIAEITLSGRKRSSVDSSRASPAAPGKYVVFTMQKSEHRVAQGHTLKLEIYISTHIR